MVWAHRSLADRDALRNEVGALRTGREPGSVMARALTEAARRTGLAAAVEHLPAAPGSQRQATARGS
ncbi:hypothetical protein [Streptomyces sp. NPDC059278]|uniref:hypothetical protein n=1 Tax=Streptomyces sp. NPDC059278 TaxID=3346801 RepID=UPI0036C2A4E5